MPAKRKSAPKQSLPRIDLFSYSSHELAAGKLTTSTLYEEAPDREGSDNEKTWMGFHSEEILRMEAGWRLRSAAFTSSLVGILGELTGEGLTLEDFKDPEVRAQLDQSPNPFPVGDSGFLDSDNLLHECWKVAADLAEIFHAQSPMVKIGKKAAAGNDGAVAKILNRYGLSLHDQPLKESAIPVRPVVVRSFDAARILRERGLIKISAPSDRLLNILIERDLTILPESGFKDMSRRWSDAELLAIHETFGAKFLDAVAGEGDLAKAMEGAKALGAMLVELLPARIRAASVYNFSLDTIPNAIDRLAKANKAAETSDLDYLREAKEKQEKRRKVVIDTWNGASVRKATDEARKRFQSADYSLAQAFFQSKLKDIKAGKYTPEMEPSYAPTYQDVRKIIAKIEEDYDAARIKAMSKLAKSGSWQSRGRGYRPAGEEPVDPALIDWVTILEGEISKRGGSNDHLTFSSFRDLIADLVFLLSDISFAFIGSTDYQRIEKLYRDKPYRRFGPLLKDLAESIREIRDGKTAGDGEVPPPSVPCSDLLMLDAMRRCWDDQRKFEVISHFNGEKLRNAPSGGVMAQ